MLRIKIPTLPPAFTIVGCHFYGKMAIVVARYLYIYNSFIAPKSRSNLKRGNGFSDFENLKLLRRHTAIAITAQKMSATGSEGINEGSA